MDDTAPRRQAAPCRHEWPDGSPMACSTAEQELTQDECSLLGLDGTGRDGNPHFPYRVGSLSGRRQMMLMALWRGDLCTCGHPGYDGHDMSRVPPRCTTADCRCGS